MRIFLLLSAALIAAVSTTYAVIDRASQPPPSIAEPSQPSESSMAMVDVLVAAQSLAAGSLLGVDDLRWQPWPEDNVDPAFVTRPTEGADDTVQTLTGSVVRRPIAPTTPLTLDSVLKPGDRGFLAAVLAPGKRAISISVNETTGLAGLVFPGDRVDLLLTHRAQDAAGFGAVPGSRQASETVLSDIRVLALDQRLESIDGVAEQARTATLEVSPTQAETVALARSMGDLTLTLNSARPDDIDVQREEDGGTGEGAPMARLMRSSPASVPFGFQPTTGPGRASPVVHAAFDRGSPPFAQHRTPSDLHTDASADEVSEDVRQLTLPPLAALPTYTLDTDVSRVLGHPVPAQADAAPVEDDTPGDADQEAEKVSHNLQVVRGSSSQMLTFGDGASSSTDEDGIQSGSTTAERGRSVANSAAGLPGL